MKIKKHSLLITVGPSGAGKSFWCNMAIPKLKTIFDNVQYISSDDTRREILGRDSHKYDQDMWGVSSQAFELCYAKLRAYMQYPAPSELIVFDSTALSKSSRKILEKIAQENHYNVELIVFDYNDENEYYAHDDNKIIRGHVARFKSLVKSIKNPLIKVQSQKDFKFTIDSLTSDSGLARTIVTKTDEKFAVIPDIHNSLPAFKRALASNSVQDCETIYCLGDFWDKGPSKFRADIADIILNSSKIVCLRGNHDHFAQHYWSGARCDVPQEILDTYFKDAITADNEFKALATAIYKESYDWIKVNNVYLSHSVCENKYKLKTDNKSIRMNRNFRHSGEGSLRDKLGWMKRQDSGQHPLHISGHIAISAPFMGKSHLMIDTGAVHGNGLTVAICSGNSTPELLRFNSEEYVKETLESI